MFGGRLLPFVLLLLAAGGFSVAKDAGIPVAKDARNAVAKDAGIPVAKDARNAVAKDALPKLGLPPIRVASFNIQVFGVTKMSKPHVVSVLLETLERYDLVFIMEIRDITGRAIEKLLAQLNSRMASSKDRYSMVISDRLGRTSSKEQYAFFYRESLFRVVSTYQYQDPQDRFERPPYGALFDVVGAHQVTRFGVLGLHTSPREAFDELQALHDVQQLARTAWRNENLLIVGDFNADCTYLNRRDKKELLLIKDPEFAWLITPCMESTMVRTTCLYDHLIARGAGLRSALDTESASVFRFDEAFGLNNTVAEEVSDHFPVEIQITGDLHSRAASLSVGRSHEVLQPPLLATATARLAIRRIGERRRGQQGSGFVTAILFDGFGDGEPRRVEATRDILVDGAGDGESVALVVADVLAQFRAAYPGVLRSHTAALLVEMTARSSPAASPSPMPGYGETAKAKTTRLRLSVSCSLEDLECSARLSALFSTPAA